MKQITILVIKPYCVFTKKSEKMLKYIIWEYDHIFRYHRLKSIDLNRGAIWINTHLFVSNTIRNEIQYVIDHTYSIWSNNWKWVSDDISIKYVALSVKHRFNIPVVHGFQLYISND